MEKKNNGGLIAIIVILVIALLGLSFYVAYDKGLIFNNEEEVEEKEESNNTDVEKEDTSQNEEVLEEGTTKYYMSANSQYELILIEHPRVSQNPKGGNVEYKFVLSIDNYYDGHLAVGSYYINNDKIDLYIVHGCVNESDQFYCNIPGINYNGMDNALQKIVTLNYSEDKIMLGNIELFKN